VGGAPKRVSKAPLLGVTGGQQSFDVGEMLEAMTLEKALASVSQGRRKTRPPNQRRYKPSSSELSTTTGRRTGWSLDVEQLKELGSDLEPVSSYWFDKDDVKEFRRDIPETYVETVMSPVASAQELPSGQVHECVMESRGSPVERSPDGEQERQAPEQVLEEQREWLPLMGKRSKLTRFSLPSLVLKRISHPEGEVTVSPVFRRSRRPSSSHEHRGKEPTTKTRVDTRDVSIQTESGPNSVLGKDHTEPAPLASTGGTEIGDPPGGQQTGDEVAKQPSDESSEQYEHCEEPALLREVPPEQQFSDHEREGNDVTGLIDKATGPSPRPATKEVEASALEGEPEQGSDEDDPVPSWEELNRTSGTVDLVEAALDTRTKVGRRSSGFSVGDRLIDYTIANLPARGLSAELSEDEVVQVSIDEVTVAEELSESVELRDVAVQAGPASRRISTSSATSSSEIIDGGDEVSSRTMDISNDRDLSRREAVEAEPEDDDVSKLETFHADESTVGQSPIGFAPDEHAVGLSPEQSLQCSPTVIERQDESADEDARAKDMSVHQGSLGAEDVELSRFDDVSTIGQEPIITPEKEHEAPKSEQRRARTPEVKTKQQRKPAGQRELRHLPRLEEWDEDGCGTTRRSDRVRFKPLKYWRNETVVYGRREDWAMPAVVGVMTAENEASDTRTSRRAKTKQVQKTSARKKQAKPMHRSRTKADLLEKGTDNEGRGAAEVVDELIAQDTENLPIEELQGEDEGAVPAVRKRNVREKKRTPSRQTAKSLKARPALEKSQAGKQHAATIAEAHVWQADDDTEIRRTRATSRKQAGERQQALDREIRIQELSESDLVPPSPDLDEHRVRKRDRGGNSKEVEEDASDKAVLSPDEECRREERDVQEKAAHEANETPSKQTANMHDTQDSPHNTSDEDDRPCKGQSARPTRTAKAESASKKRQKKRRKLGVVPESVRKEIERLRFGGIHAI